MKSLYLLLCNFIIISAFAAPSNDLCADATEITPGTSCNYVEGTFSGAGRDGNATTFCSSAVSQDVWYRFTATEKMNRISLTGTPGISNGFEVYDSGCSGSLIMCTNANNGPGSFESSYYSNYIVGHVYYVRVFNAYSTPSNNNFSICVQSFTAPVNDMCANATTLTPALTCVPVTVNLSGASLDGQYSTDCLTNSSQDVWYKFIATDEMMGITISGANDISNGFDVYETNCSGNKIICRNAAGAGNGESVLYNHFVVGSTYYIRVVNAYTTPSVSNFNICLQRYPSPTNDLCSNATLLTPNSNCTYTTGTFSGANLDGNPSTTCSPTNSQDVWYRFLATNATMSIKISGIEFGNNAFEVYDGGCSGNMMICRNLQGQDLGEDITYNGFVVGREYFIRVSNAFAVPLNTSSFGICLQDSATLETDDHRTNPLVAYPNPTKGTIEIKNINGSAHYELYDSVGKTVKADQLRSGKIDLSNLPKGVYILKIENNGNTKIQKIINE